MPRSRDPFEQFMEEREKLSAPFKLMLRLMRSRKTPPTPQSPSFLKEIVGWEGFSFVFFAGIGLTILGLPHQYGKSRICFVLAAIALVLKLVHSIDAKHYPKLVIGILGAVVAGVSVNKVNDWVTDLERASVSNDVPKIRLIVTKNIVPKPQSPRSYLAFDGIPRFGERKDEKGQFLADQNFQVGDQLFFNYYYEASGPNPVTVIGTARRVYIEPDFEVNTQQAMIDNFKTRLARERKERKVKPVLSKFMAQDGGRWNTAYASAVGDDKQPRIVTQSDLDALRFGTEIAFVVIEMEYLDNKQVHHLRTCEYLKPPASPPGIWHFCDLDFNSD